MKFQKKNNGKNSGLRFDVGKLGLITVVASCIIAITYYISLSQSPVNQQKLKDNIITEDHVVISEQIVEPKDTSSKQPENNAQDLSDKNKDKNKELDPRLEKSQPNKMPDKQGKQICDLSHHRSDVCEFIGDVRVDGKSNLISLIDKQNVYSYETQEWKIRPYARKMLPNVPEVNLKLSKDIEGAPRCAVNHSKPAIVFANGGFTGNYYHDYTDILVPLFTTAWQFKGEVHFVVNNIQIWWLHKFWPMIKGLSRYEIIDYDHDGQVHCFPHIIVGMYFHNDVTIDPRRPPFGLSMVNFTRFLRDSYSLPRQSAINLREKPEKKPRLLVITRHGTRRFTNADEIVKMAQDLNFEVVAEDQSFGANVSTVAHHINSFDVMMGVHGAGLTNFVFLPTNAVLIQIVPWGKLEHMCMYDFGYPSINAKLNYIQYSICVDESTLLGEYPRDHAVFTDPTAIHNLGWDEMGKIYLEKQNVKLDVNRFRPVLQEALGHLGR